MVDDLLRELLLEVRSLRLDLAESRSAGDVRLGLLLRAVHAALGTADFSAAELVELAGARLSTRIALQAAVQAVVGKTRHRAKSLGHFLRNNAGAGVDGLRLVKVRAGLFRIERRESGGGQHWPS